jgi:ATP-dependent DNA helicase RecQ
VVLLTGEGVALMKDAAAMPAFSLARQRKPEKRAKGEPRARGAASESWEGVDRDLFDRLRALRLSIARARGVPPYVVFHDTTLRELARIRPTTVAELQHVYGIGARKAEDLGELIVNEIQGSFGTS